MVENLCDSSLNRLKLRKPKDFDKFRKIALFLFLFQCSVSFRIFSCVIVYDSQLKAAGSVFQRSN